MYTYVVYVAFLDVHKAWKHAYLVGEYAPDCGGRTSFRGRSLGFSDPVHLPKAIMFTASWAAYRPHTIMWAGWDARVATLLVSDISRTAEETRETHVYQPPCANVLSGFLVAER